MNLELTPQLTCIVLASVLTAHLLHHHLAGRHISYAEILSSAVLSVPLTLNVPSWLYMTVHLGLTAVQIVGSMEIRRFSPDCPVPIPISTPASRSGYAKDH